MSIYSYLHKDHERIKKSMREIEGLEAEDSARRSALFVAFTKELCILMQAKDNAFYPPLKRYGFLSDSIERADLKRQKALQLLEELRGRVDSSSDWQSLFAALKKTVETHLKEEEHEFFPMVAGVLDQNVEQKMKLDMDSEKSRIRKSLRHGRREPEIA